MRWVANGPAQIGHTDLPQFIRDAMRDVPVFAQYQGRRRFTICAFQMITGGPPRTVSAAHD